MVLFQTNVSMVHRSLASGPLQGRWIPFGNQTQTVQTVNPGVSKNFRSQLRGTPAQVPIHPRIR